MSLDFTKYAVAVEYPKRPARPVEPRLKGYPSDERVAQHEKDIAVYAEQLKIYAKNLVEYQRKLIQCRDA